MLKKLLVMVLVMTVLAGNLSASAATNKKLPGRPVISVETVNNTDIDCIVKISIEKTDNADGFYIYEKRNDSDDYQKIFTLKKSGTKKRTYEVTYDYDCQPSFKVCAYNNNGCGKYSKVKKVSVVLNPSKNVKSVSDSSDGKKGKKDNKSYIYKDISLEVPASWGDLNTDNDMLYSEWGNFTFMMYGGSLDNKKLTQKKADKIVKKEYGSIYNSIKISTSDTCEYNNKKIQKYYLYNTKMNKKYYSYQYTGRMTRSPDGTMSMYYKQVHVDSFKGCITVFEYKGNYYVAAISINKDDYNKNSFNEYKDVINSIKVKS